VVIGESMGSMVAARVAAESADGQGARDNLRFVLIAPPEAGVAEYFKEGTFIPVLNYRVSRVPQSSYPTTVVIGEYDGWADPPDRPWNIPAALNAVLGVVFVHGPPIAAADPATAPAANITVDGNVTTYLVPTDDLPLTQPLRLVGVPDQLADRVDQVLRPVIDAGYVRHDEPGDTRPYLHDGEIRRNVQNRQQAREPWPKLRLDRRDRPSNRGESPLDVAAPRQAGGPGGWTGSRIVARLGQQLEKQADRRAARAERVHSTLHSPRPSAKKAVGTRDQ
jgi:diacyltrehalose acyltransferase